MSSVRKSTVTLIHFIPDGINNITYLVPGVITIEKYVEFVSGESGYNSSVITEKLEHIGSSLYIVVSEIMTIGVVHILKIIHIPHEKCSSFEFFRSSKQLTHSVNVCTSVKKSCSNIIVTLVLYLLFLDNTARNIHYKSDNIILSRHYTPPEPPVQHTAVHIYGSGFITHLCHYCNKTACRKTAAVIYVVYKFQKFIRINHSITSRKRSDTQEFDKTFTHKDTIVTRLIHKHPYAHINHTDYL